MNNIVNKYMKDWKMKDKDTADLYKEMKEIVRLKTCSLVGCVKSKEGTNSIKKHSSIVEWIHRRIQ